MFALVRRGYPDGLSQRWKSTKSIGRREIGLNSVLMIFVQPTRAWISAYFPHPSPNSDEREGKSDSVNLVELSEIMDLADTIGLFSEENCLKLKMHPR